jgi:hypothetical protein
MSSFLAEAIPLWTAAERRDDLGGEEVKVVVRSPFGEMKASPWEKEDAMHEDIPILDNHVPKQFVVERRKSSKA